MTDSEFAKAMNALRIRCEGQAEWLHENHPEVFTEQKHTRTGTIERAYWHYGYRVALRDTLALLSPETDGYRPHPIGHA